MGGVELSVMVWCGWKQLSVNGNHIHPSLMCVKGSHVCIKACVLLQGQQVFFWCWDVLPTQDIVQKALGKSIGFGDDVVAQQPPSYPCLVVHNTVCHVTPCVFPFFQTMNGTVLQSRMSVVFVVSMLSCSVQLLEQTLATVLSQICTLSGGFVERAVVGVLTSKGTM